MKKMKIIQISLFTLALAGVMACGAKKKIVGTPASSFRNVETTAADFDYIYSEGLRHKFMGNGNEALRYFVTAMRMNPDNDAVYYQISQLALSMGDFRTGKTYAKRAYELDNKNIWYSSLLAGIYYQENKIDSAIYVYEKTVEFSPNSDESLLILANLYSENGDYENAVKAHQQFHQKYGVNENTTPAYIQNLIFANKLDLAMEIAQEAIIVFPDEVIFYTQLAETYGKKGEDQKALEVYKKLLEEDPHNSQILMSICDFLLGEQRYYELFQVLSPIIQEEAVSKEEKISFFAKILSIPSLPGDVVNHTLLALMVFEAVYDHDDVVVLIRPELLDKYNRQPEAIKRLEDIVSKRPDNYFAWEKLLLLYYETKDYDKLFKRGEEGASRFNRSFLAKILYAVGAYETKHYDIALEELRKAAILAGNDEKGIMQVLTMKSTVLYKMNDYAEAFKTFEEALKVDPDEIVILNNYAYYLAERNTELKKAEAMSRKVIESEKNSATYLDTYAWVLFKMGKTRKAAKIMEQVIAQGADLSAEHYEHYGYILKKMRKCREAIINWQMAIKLDSSKVELYKEIQNCGRR